MTWLFCALVLGCKYLGIQPPPPPPPPSDDICKTSYVVYWLHMEAAPALTKWGTPYQSCHFLPLDALGRWSFWQMASYFREHPFPDGTFASFSLNGTHLYTRFWCKQPQNLSHSLPPHATTVFSPSLTANLTQWATLAGVTTMVLPKRTTVETTGDPEAQR